MSSKRIERPTFMHTADKQFYGIAASRHAESTRDLHAIQTMWGVPKNMRKDGD